MLLIAYLSKANSHDSFPRVMVFSKIIHIFALLN